MTESQWNAVNGASAVDDYTLTLFVDGQMVRLTGEAAIEMLERFARGLGIEA